jgi:AcrR family transcriptional regulator
VAKPTDSGRIDLLEAAAHEFADLGYAGATTAGIARRAGVTQPLVHHHFGSKQGLWRVLTDALFGDLRRMLDGVAADHAGAPSVERVRALLQALVRFCGAHPYLPRLMRTEGRLGSQTFDDLWNRWLGGLVQLFRAEIGAAVADGTLRHIDPAMLYFLVVGAAVEPFCQPETARRAFGLDMADPAAIDRYADALVDAFLFGMITESRR